MVEIIILVISLFAFSGYASLKAESLREYTLMYISYFGLMFFLYRTLMTVQEILLKL